MLKTNRINKTKKKLEFMLQGHTGSAVMSFYACMRNPKHIKRHL